MSMPWDVYKPEVEPEPVPEPPVEQPWLPPGPIQEIPNLPEKREDFDFNKILKDAFSEALREAGPKLKESAKDYARDSWEAIRSGESVDIFNPTITAETEQGHELVVADARSRSWRTFVQGLAVDVLFAVVASVAMLTGLDPFVKETWIAFGVLLLKSVLSAVVSYFMRLKAAPTIRVPGEKMVMMPIPRPTIDEDDWKERSA